MHQTQAGTECTQAKLEFQALGGRRVEADFSGGHLSSEGGSLLLRQIDGRLGLCDQLAGCFMDRRDQRFVEHDLAGLLRQRIFALALGYEDLNDHDNLRRDPLLAAACGRADVLGEQRHQAQDAGCPLAGKSTLNRLELGAQECTLTKKIHANADKVRDLLLEMAVAAIPRKRGVIVLDFDATDDLLHGHQEGRFYHGYYKGYCYLPLYCFCADVPLWAQLRTADGDAARGTLEALEKIVGAIRSRFGRQVIIIVRADSGFCRDELMSWIETQPRLYYVLGLARNVRLQQMLVPAFWRTAQKLDPEAVLLARAAGAQAPPELEGTAREFEELRYRTCKSWSRERRVIGKAEVTQGKTNPRFIVTNISTTESWAQGDEQFATGSGLYERFYCARGNMENRIKEQQLDLFADRTSTAWQSSNQLRLWFSTFAYLLLSRLRAVALQGTSLANATVGTIRLKLLKIAALTTVSVRRIHVQLPRACTMKEIFGLAQRRMAGCSP